MASHPMSKTTLTLGIYRLLIGRKTQRFITAGAEDLRILFVSADDEDAPTRSLLPTQLGNEGIESVSSARGTSNMARLQISSTSGVSAANCRSTSPAVSYLFMLRSAAQRPRRFTSTSGLRC